MKKLFTFLMLFFSVVSVLNASACNNYQRDKAEYFAEKFGNDFVDGIGGGQNVVVKLEQCDYNTYSKQFRLRIDIQFDGALISSHHYEVEGILKVNNDGTTGSFAKTWTNQQFDDLQFWEKVATGVIGGIIILNDMSQQNDNNQ